jgi:hypothetical protein
MNADTPVRGWRAMHVQVPVPSGWRDLWRLCRAARRGHGHIDCVIWVSGVAYVDSIRINIDPRERWRP